MPIEPFRNLKALRVPAGKRPTVELEMGDEFVVKSGRRSFIIRGTRDTLQIFGADYVKSEARRIFAGTIRGVVVGSSFSIGYESDISSNTPIFLKYD